MPEWLEELFDKNTDALASSLDKAMQDVLPEYEQLHQVGLKGELSDIYISFLQSGVLCKLPWLRIDLCDEQGRDNLTECSTDWDVQVISDRLYHDVDMMAKQNNRMADYELEQAWLKASGEYFQGFEKFLPRIISRCSVAQTISCRWHFGQYLGNVITVREKEKDEIL